MPSPQAVTPPDCLSITTEISFRSLKVLCRSLNSRWFRLMITSACDRRRPFVSEGGDGEQIPRGSSCGVQIAPRTAGRTVQQAQERKSRRALTFKAVISSTMYL